MYALEALCLRKLGLAFKKAFCAFGTADNGGEHLDGQLTNQNVYIRNEIWAHLEQHVAPEKMVQIYLPVPLVVEDGDLEAIIVSFRVPGGRYIPDEC